MLRRLITLLTACAFSIPLVAQQGTAPNGYYPNTYAGSTFSGALEVTKGDPQQITLVYTKGTKSERFVGRLAAPCTWKSRNGASHTFENSEYWKDTVLIAFYQRVTKKSEGKKISENLIIAISVSERFGKKLPEDMRIIIYCTDEPLLFKPFM